MPTNTLQVPTYTANFDNENAARIQGQMYGHRGFKWQVVRIGHTWELRIYGGLSR